MCSLTPYKEKKKYNKLVWSVSDYQSRRLREVDFKDKYDTFNI